MTNYNYLKNRLGKRDGSSSFVLWFSIWTQHCVPSSHPSSQKMCSHPASQPAHKPLAHMEQSFFCHLRIRIGFGNSEFGIGGSVRQRIADSAASEWILNLGFVIASKPGRRKEHRIGVGVGLATLVAWQSWQDFSGAFVWGLVIDWWPGDWIWVWHCVGIGGGKVIGLECGLIRCCF